MKIRPWPAYLAILSITILAGLLGSSSQRPLQIWSNVSNIGYVHWDTGYGYDSQSKKAKPEEGQETEIGPDGLRLFSQITIPKITGILGLKICRRDPNLRIFFREKSGFKVSRAIAIDASGCSYLALPSEKDMPGRTAVDWAYFFLGANLLATLIFGWLYFFCSCRLRESASEKSFFALGGLVLAGTLAIAGVFYPGFVNSREPLDILRGEINFQYSALLSVIWFSLQETVFGIGQIQFFLNAFQLVAFGAGAAYASRALGREGAPAWILVIGTLLLILNPAALSAHFYLVRGQAAGYLNFLWWECILLALLRPGTLANAQIIGLSALGLIAMLLRLDNVPLFLMATGFLIWRFGQAKKLLAVGLISITAYLLIGSLEKDPKRGPWYESYVSRNAKLTVEHFSLSADLRTPCLMDNSSTVTTVRSSLICFGSNFDLFLRSRWESMKDMFFRPQMLLLTQSLEEKGRIAALRDFRAERRSTEKQIMETRPYSLIRLLDATNISCWEYGLPALAILASLFLFPIAPAVAMVSCMVFARLLFLFAFSEYGKFHAFFDVHLWGIFLPFAILAEWKIRAGKLRLNH